MSYQNNEAVSKGDAVFGFNLMQHLGEGNVTFSPYSIRTAMAMLYEGASGKTAQELSDVLLFPTDKEQRHKAYHELVKSINSESEAFTLKTANGLWMAEKFPVNSEYKDILTKFYQSEANSADFEGNSEFWRGNINKWIGDKTEEKIPEMFPKGSINPLTAYVLANALYFQGFWQSKFAKEHTQKQDFTLPSGEVVKVDMMRKGELEGGDLPKFGYLKREGVQIVNLPYKGRDVSKTVLLPPKDVDIGQMEDYLRENPEELQEWIYAAMINESEFYRLEIPKHEVRGSYKLNGPLQSMGIEKVFTFDAELEKMGPGPLGVGLVQHESYFKTDEEGSEGAAATGISFVCLGISAPKPKVEFVADKPYLEIIQHVPTNSLLFINRIADPR